MKLLVKRKSIPNPGSHHESPSLLAVKISRDKTIHAAKAMLYKRVP
jgi:hypothetical protein